MSKHERLTPLPFDPRRLHPNHPLIREDRDRVCAIEDRDARADAREEQDERLFAQPSPAALRAFHMRRVAEYMAEREAEAAERAETEKAERAKRQAAWDRAHPIEAEANRQLAVAEAVVKAQEAQAARIRMVRGFF